MTSFKSGVLCAVGSYAIWGTLPLFWHLLLNIPPMQILASRIIFSFVFVAALLLVLKKTKWLAHFKTAEKRNYFLLGALFISCNWGLYIWAINSGHTIEASLGYYINPLVSILLGFFFLKERLTPLQWAAFILCAIGVSIPTVLSGTFPWISVLLALTFGLYGLFKKKIVADTLETLCCETLVALPIAAFLLLIPFAAINASPETTALFGERFQLSGIRLRDIVFLILAGPVTALPLLLFSQGARLIPLSALGFVQFISPTITLIIGIFIFHEPFGAANAVTFSFVAGGVLLYTLSLVQKSYFQRQR
ncbi:chloramphenicol-sensitive protein RarD [Spirochaetia bacterium]|nr:chloramphenicol-sensitive protein RarD [Spirochaetia bacterium]